MIIREFLPMKLKRMLPNGKEMWILEKNLYAVLFKEQSWIGMDAEAVQQAHETDCATGMPIPREEGVHYKDFSTV
jgi:hypothetical protein